MLTHVVVGSRQDRRQWRARALAASTAVILCAVGLLGRHHEAATVHVRDTAGGIHHAQRLAEDHESSSSAHLHGRADHGHAGECTLLAIAHSSIVLPATAIAAPIPAAARELDLPAVVQRTARATYRLAPKTSPPHA